MSDRDSGKLRYPMSFLVLDGYHREGGSIAPGSVGLGGLIAVLHSLLSLPFHLQVLWSLCDISSGPLPHLRPHVSASLTLLCTFPLHSGLFFFFSERKKKLLLKGAFRITNQKGRTKKRSHKEAAL